LPDAAHRSPIEHVPRSGPAAEPKVPDRSPGLTKYRALASRRMSASRSEGTGGVGRNSRVSGGPPGRSNPQISRAPRSGPSRGSIRETFLVAQLRHADDRHWRIRHGVERRRGDIRRDDRSKVFARI
jgi:hypothetical protein